MKIFFPVIVLIFLNLTAIEILAQHENQKPHLIDILHFNGGVRLYGKIIHADEDEVEFELTNGEVVFIPKNIIKKIIQTYGKFGFKKIMFYHKKPYEFKEQGIYQSTMVNFPQGYALADYANYVRNLERFNLSDYRYWKMGIGIHHVCGIQHNRQFGTGIGLGFDGYDISNGKNILSVYAESRGYLTAKRVSPYYSIGLGYGISLPNKGVGSIINSKGGLFFNPSVGYRFGSSSKANFVLSFGYRLQIATYTERYRMRAILIRKHYFNRFNTNFGLVF